MQVHLTLFFVVAAERAGFYIGAHIGKQAGVNWLSSTCDQESTRG